MTSQIKTALLEALKLYEASVKRAQNAKPRFASVYDAELTEINTARIWVNAQKVSN